MSTRNNVLALTVIAVAAILVWRFALQPAPGETTSAGAAMVRVSIPALSADAVAGEMLFNENCATCHGKNAAGQDGIAPPLVHVIYEPNHHGDASFHLAAQRGVRAHHWPFGDMPPVDGVNGDEIDKIVAYVRTLQRANGIR